MSAALDERRTPLQLQLDPEPDSVAKARHAVTEYARRVNAQAEDIALAVSEAVSNAVLHAYRDDRQSGTISVHAFCEDDTLVVSVSDDGVGVTPNPDSPGLGLGLALIGSLSQNMEMRSEGRGTTLIMRFPCADC